MSTVNLEKGIADLLTKQQVAEVKHLAKKEALEEMKQLPYKSVYAEKIGMTEKEISDNVAEALKGVKTELEAVEKDLAGKLALIDALLENGAILKLKYTDLLKEYAKLLPDTGEVFDPVKFNPMKNKIEYIERRLNKETINIILNQEEKSVARTTIENTILPRDEIIARILNHRVDEIKNVIQSVKSIDGGAEAMKKKVIDAINELELNIKNKMHALKSDILGDGLKAKEFIENVQEWIRELLKPQNLIFILASITSVGALVASIESGKKVDKADIKLPPKQ